MPQASTNCENRIWRYRETRRNSDYTYARSRSTKLKENSRLERGYDVAIHFVKEIASRRQWFGENGMKRYFASTQIDGGVKLATCHRWQK